MSASPSPHRKLRPHLEWLWRDAPLTGRERLFWAGFACLLCAHAVFSGLVLDDFFVLHQVENASLRWGLSHAFDFTSAAPDFASGLERGLWPWWTSEQTMFRFFRPLAALTHALDVRLFHDAPWLMHLESLLLLLLLTLAALKWFHALFPATPRVARIAGVLYAMSPGHGVNASWLSARNACLASLFAVLALLTHHRARCMRQRGQLALSTLCLALSLLSGELGLSTLALLLSYACFLDQAPWRERLVWLTPALAVAACWLVAYVMGQYGVRASAIYLSLLHDPLDYLKSAAIRLPILLLGSFGWPVIAFSVLLSGTAQALLALFGLVFFAVLAPRIVRVVRSDARARFCAAAFGLSTLPVLSTIPHDRLLMIAELGALPLLVLALLSGNQAGASPTRGGRGLLLSRLTLSVPFMLINSGAVWQWVKIQRQPFEVSLPAEETQSKTLVFVNAPCVVFASYLFTQRAYHGLPGPRRVRALAQGTYGLTVTRLDAYTLSLRSEAGLVQAIGAIRTNDGHQVPAFSMAYTAQILNQIALPDPRIPVGTRVRLSDVTLTVVETTSAGWPRELHARFHAPLESEALQFVQWKDAGWRAWPLPDVGQIVTFEPILE